MVTKVQEYVQALRSGANSFSTSGLCGRIIRGKQPADFLSLTDDPTRKLVMVLGPDGLRTLLGKSGYKMLLAIGYDKPYIESKVSGGTQFKLVVFSQQAANAKKAIWSHVVASVSEAYPDAAGLLKQNLPVLKCLRTPAAKGWRKDVDWFMFCKAVGFDPAEVDKIGRDDPRFMTYERFVSESAGDVFAARLFLYFTLYLKELYGGDGYTYNGQGKRGATEYIVPNKPIASLGEHELVDIEVSLP